MQQAGPVAARPASAVALLRDREGGGIGVFLVRRHAAIEFMPDVYVFPGGSVTPSDVEAELRPGLCAPAAAGATALGTGFRAAAVRECFEEAGVLLLHVGGGPLAITAEAARRIAAYREQINARGLPLHEIARREGAVLATDLLVYWAHWITPEIYPKRFDAHFFLTEMPPGQEATHDMLETTGGLWISPEDALRAAADGALPIVEPTTYQLRALTGFETVADAQACFAARTPRTVLPRVVMRDGQEVTILPEGV